MVLWSYSLFFFFNDTATTEIYTLSLHDALPICRSRRRGTNPARSRAPDCPRERHRCVSRLHRSRDRKSTRLNSSHSQISYAVFCLKKKTTTLPSTELVRLQDTSIHTPRRTRPRP